VVDGVVLTLIDATGLKMAENALFHERHLLDSLLANLPEAIYFKDSAGKFIRANPAMAARLGVDGPEALAGKSAPELPRAELALALQRHDEPVLRTGQAQNYSLEQGDDGRWDLVTRLPIHDPDGNIVGTTGIFRDVTDQKRAEEDIREAVRRRDQFLAMLSHELRNPLSAIVSATSLLRTGGGEPQKSQRFLDVLARQTQQMSRLLDELLEASRVTQNKIELRKEPLDLNDVVRAAVDAARAQIDARGLDMVTTLAAEPLPIEGDAARLEQVLANLLSNAAKYTPAGGHVTVTTSRVEGAAEIRVKDDGAGIAPELLQSVFDLFVQSRRTLDRAAGGLGVGLSLVRALVEMHGGQVTAASAGEGQGSEFVVSLPLGSEAPVAGERRPGGADAPASPDGACAVPEGGTVLVVEDNEDSREMLCEMLTMSGVDCVAVDSGASALALLQRLRPHSAIIDLGLPGINGLELARRIRALPEHAGMCLLALTGYGQPSDRTLSKGAGFDAHLVKPVRVEQLLAVLSETRNQRRQTA
jgi:two-component system CheB/CheR fusion protein